jgi:hypothetical protein
MLIPLSIVLATLPQDPTAATATPAPRPTIVWGDADGDGLADAFLVGPAGAARLLRNRGDGGFDDVTSEAGLAGLLAARFAAWSDYDGDGQRDLLVGTDAGTRLFAGQGRGTFAEVTAEAGIAHGAPDASARWIDYDGDGRADLDLAGAAGGFLYHNAGAGRFELVELGLDAARPASAPGKASTPDASVAPAPAPGSDAPATPSVVPGGTSSLPALAAPVGRRPVDLDVPGASEDATAALSCARSIEDRGMPGSCLAASSVPTLGRLYPLSTRLFVDDATGFVGIGTTAPLVNLHVQGALGVASQIFGHDIELGTDDDTITFSASSGTNAPMIQMFASGITNADRMVIAHSPGAPTYGLSYEDDDDKFVFQMMPTDPTLTIDLGQSVDSAVDVNLRDDDDSITFSAASGATSPMIQMYASGTSNATRQVLAHSPALPEWGLKVDDTNDTLVFQQSNSLPVLTLGLQTKNVTVHDGTLAVTRATAGNALDVQTGASTQSRVANIQRTNDAQLNEDILQVVCGTNSSTGAQLIEAERGTDLEFRVDVSGSVFADGAFTGPADFAEMMTVTAGAGTVEPGDVLVLDDQGGVARASHARSARVAGIYSTRPGFVGSEREWDLPASDAGGELATLGMSDMKRLYGEVPVAVIGVVPAKVSAENGPIRPGDLLVTASTPGHAMRASHPAPGTVVGKALGSLDAGTGTIRVLVTLQ